MKGILKIFFKNGRLIPEFILSKCSIDITYALLSEGVSVRVIVITSTAGGVAGFTVSWLSVGATFVVPPVLISALLFRSLTQQIFNQREYWKFKKMVAKLLNDEDLKEPIRVFFMEGEDPAPSSGRLEMGLSDLDKNPALNHDSSLNSNEDLEAVLEY